MNVYEITKKYLIENGYDGLFTDECGCLGIHEKPISAFRVGVIHAVEIFDAMC